MFTTFLEAGILGGLLAFLVRLAFYLPDVWDFLVYLFKDSWESSSSNKVFLSYYDDSDDDYDDYYENYEGYTDYDNYDSYDPDDLSNHPYHDEAENFLSSVKSIIGSEEHREDEEDDDDWFRKYKES